MKGKVMMNTGIVALSAQSFAGVLMTGILRIGFLTDGGTRMADGFPAGMSAIRNRYLNAIFAPSGSSATGESMVTGYDR